MNNTSSRHINTFLDSTKGEKKPIRLEERSEAAQIALECWVTDYPQKEVGGNAGKYLNQIDADNRLALQEICSRDGKTISPEEPAGRILVEQRKDNPNRSHICILSHNEAVNKHKPSKKARAVHIARTKVISKKQQLPEFRRKWQNETDRINRIVVLERQNETDILSRVIRLEIELGHEPTLLDLLCRFNRVEIQAVWDSLVCLYPDLDRKEHATIPSGHRANRELMKVMA
jgi:hypothetical protein